MLKTKTQVRRCAATLGAVAVFAAPLPAYAHDAVLDSNPQDGAVVKEFPGEVSLEFSGMIKRDFNTFAITDLDSGEQIFTGEPTVDGQIASLIVPEDKRASDGKYQLGYQITSSDGHATRGKIVFEVSGSAKETPASSEQAAQSGTPTSQSQNKETTEGKGAKLGVISGVAAAVILLGVVLVAVKQRREH